VSVNVEASVLLATVRGEILASPVKGGLPCEDMLGERQ